MYTTNGHLIPLRIFSMLHSQSKFSILCGRKTLHNYLSVTPLLRSAGITDSGILTIARGCPGLEMINISYCKDITDSSLISLSKCLRLNTLESRGCPLITSLGLAAVAVGCKQLTKLDIKKCCNINDAGMIPLAHFSQNLRQVLLSLSLSLSQVERRHRHLTRVYSCLHTDKFVI